MLLAALALALAPTQEDVSPAEALRARAEAAARPVVAARYEGRAATSSALAYGSRVVEGSVLVARGPDGGPRARVDARVRDPLAAGEAAVQHVLLVRAGERWEALVGEPDGTRWTTAGADPWIGGGVTRAAAALLATPLLAADPYPEAWAWELGAPAVLAGERVLELRGRSPDGALELTVLLGAADALPRSVARTERRGTDALHDRLTVRALVLEPEPPAAEPFRLAPGEDVERRAPEPPPPAVGLPTGPPPEVVSLADSLEPLRAAFEAASGELRVLALFAPT